MSILGTVMSTSMIKTRGHHGALGKQDHLDRSFR
jgi:hypothetical protein